MGERFLAPDQGEPCFLTFGAVVVLLDPPEVFPVWVAVPTPAHRSSLLLGTATPPFEVTRFPIHLAPFGAVSRPSIQGRRSTSLDLL